MIVYGPSHAQLVPSAQICVDLSVILNPVLLSV